MITLACLSVGLISSFAKSDGRTAHHVLVDDSFLNFFVVPALNEIVVFHLDGPEDFFVSEESEAVLVLEDFLSFQLLDEAVLARDGSPCVDSS